MQAPSTHVPEKRSRFSTSTPSRRNCANIAGVTGTDGYIYAIWDVPAYTFWYLQACPELLGLAAERLERWQVEQ